MPLTPTVAAKVPVRICNFAGTDVNAGPKTWSYLAI